MEMVAQVMSNFRFAAASYESDGEKVRTLVEIDSWDDKGKRIWGNFPTDIIDHSQPLLLKCVHKSKNLYVTVKGAIDTSTRRVRGDMEYQAFNVEQLMVARKEDPEAPIAVFKIMVVVDYDNTKPRYTKQTLRTLTEQEAKQAV